MSPKLRNVNPVSLASSLPMTVFPTPGVPMTMMIFAKDCSGAPAGTLRPIEAFEPGSPDRESGILSAMCRPVYTTGADAPGKYVSVKDSPFPQDLESIKLFFAGKSIPHGGTKLTLFATNIAHNELRLALVALAEFQKISLAALANVLVFLW